MNHILSDSSMQFVHNYRQNRRAYYIFKYITHIQYFQVQSSVITQHNKY